MKNKNILLLLGLLMLSQAGFARSFALYTDFGGGFGNFRSGKIGINGIYNGVCFGAAYYGQGRTADYVPDDYEAGLVIFGRSKPQYHLGSGCFTAGKVFELGSPYVRLLAKGGISVCTAEYPVYYTHRTPGWFESNYDITWEVKNGVGFFLNPTVEFPLGAAFGISTGMWMNINTDRTSYGVEANILLGKLRNRLRGGFR